MIAMTIYLTLAGMHLVNLARLRMSRSDVVIDANDEIESRTVDGNGCFC